MSGLAEPADSHPLSSFYALSCLRGQLSSKRFGDFYRTVLERSLVGCFANAYLSYIVGKETYLRDFVMTDAIAERVTKADLVGVAEEERTVAVGKSVVLMGIERIVGIEKIEDIEMETVVPEPGAN